MSMAGSLWVINNEEKIWCTGKNGTGELGLGHNNNVNTLTFNGSLDVRDVAAGHFHYALITSGNELWMCGRNDHGQLGNGNATNQNRNIHIMGNVKYAFCGCYNTFIIKTDGTVWATGRNNAGQLGIGTTNNISTFTKIPNMTDVRFISAGLDHTLILKNDCTLWVAGSNGEGQLGFDSSVSSKTTFTKVCDRVRLCRASYSASFIVKTDSFLYSCGDNRHGTLGLGHNNAKVFEFTKNNKMYGIKAIDTGSFGVVVQKDDGRLWVTGHNGSGQLGLGHKNNINTFQQLGIRGVRGFACGADATYVLKENGTLWATGINNSGELGLGDWSDRTVFTHVTNVPSNINKLMDYNGYVMHNPVSANSEATLRAALEGSNSTHPVNGETIKLTSNISLTSGKPINVKLDRIVLDLNGKTITGNKTCTLFYMKAKELTIIDSSDNYWDSKITGGKGNVKDACSAAEPAIGTNADNLCGGAFYLYGCSKLDLVNGNITGNRVEAAGQVRGGAIAAYYSEVVIHNARINSNFVASTGANAYCGAVAMNHECLLTMYGGQINDNYAKSGTGNNTSRGGAIYAYDKSFIVVYDGEIKGNYIDSPHNHRCGSALLAGTSSRIDVMGGLIKNNYDKNPNAMLKVGQVEAIDNSSIVTTEKGGTWIASSDKCKDQPIISMGPSTGDNGIYITLHVGNFKSKFTDDIYKVIGTYYQDSDQNKDKTWEDWKKEKRNVNIDMNNCDMFYENKVCAIGNTFYDTVQAAITAASGTSDTLITLCKDCLIDETILIDKDKIRLNLDGFGLVGTYLVPILKLKNINKTTKTVITDLSKHGGGFIARGGNNNLTSRSALGGGIIIKDNCDTDISNIQILDNRCILRDGGNYGNYAFSAGIHANANVNITDCYIYKNRCISHRMGYGRDRGEGRGAGIYFTAATRTLNLTRVAIIENVIENGLSHGRGAGIFSDAADGYTTTINVNRSQITGNKIEYEDDITISCYGSGIGTLGNAHITLADFSSISNNTSRCHGGLFLDNKSSCTLKSSCAIIGNKIRDNDGADVYLWNTSTFEAQTGSKIRTTPNKNSIYSVENTGGGNVVKLNGIIVTCVGSDTVNCDNIIKYDSKNSNDKKTTVTGTYQVNPNQFKNMTTNKEYVDLRQAISELKDGETLKQLSHYWVMGPLTFTEKSNITYDGDGKLLTTSYNSTILHIVNVTNMTINNLNVCFGKGTIRPGSAQTTPEQDHVDAASGGIYIQGSSVTLDNVSVRYNCILHRQGRGYSEGAGVGIYRCGTKAIRLNNCTVSYNHVFSKGRIKGTAINCIESLPQFTNCNISYNKANNWTNHLDRTSKGTINFESCTGNINFESTEICNNGVFGRIYFEGTAISTTTGRATVLNFNNCTISENIGRAIYGAFGTIYLCGDSNATFNNCNINDNGLTSIPKMQTSENAWGDIIHLYQNAQATFKGTTTCSLNSVARSGGSMFFIKGPSAKINIEGATISDRRNEAPTFYFYLEDPDLTWDSSAISQFSTGHLIKNSVSHFLDSLTSIKAGVPNQGDNHGLKFNYSGSMRMNNQGIVCTINDKNYYDLERAINDNLDNKSFTILSDTKVPYGFTLANTGITIDLNGKTLTCDQRLMTMRAKSVSIEDNSMEKTGKIVAGNGYASSSSEESKGGAFYMGDSSSLYINGGEISGGNTGSDGKGGAIYAFNNSEINLNKGKIKNNKAKLGGAIFLTDNSSFIMNGGLLQNNIATTNGNEVYLNPGCTFRMTDGIVDNTGNETNNLDLFYINDTSTQPCTIELLKGHLWDLKKKKIDETIGWKNPDVN